MEKDQIRIMIDRRESVVYQEIFAELGASVDIKTLTTGDFILSDRVAAERKTRADFENSILDSRLFEQASRLKDTYQRSIMVIEGNSDSARISRSALLGAYSSLIVEFGISLFFTKNPRSTCELLYSIARYEQISKKRAIQLKSKPKFTSLSQAQEVLVCSIPNMGPKKACLLLEHFGSPIRLFSADESELLKVPGIGKKQIDFLKSVLYSDYKSKNK